MKKSILIDVPGSESRLLLYMADELPPADRAQVDQMLAQDAQLRDTLASLQRLDDRARRSLATPHVSDVDRAIRSAQSALRQSVAAPAPSLTPKTEPVRLPLPWWMYPMAAAAAILIASAMFVANRSPRALPPSYAMPIAGYDAIQSGVDVAPELSTYEAYSAAEDLAASFDDAEHVLAGARSNQLLLAASELDEIRASSRAFGDMVIQ